MFRIVEGQLEAFLVHPGGPYFKKKDVGAWTIPKGEIEEGESMLDTAKREFQEETGIQPIGKFISIDSVTQKGGKTVHAWAFEGDWDESKPLKSNDFEIEWPPRSGKKQKFPEIDRAEFFSLDIAKQKINTAQIEFLDKLENYFKSE